MNEAIPKQVNCLHTSLYLMYTAQH